MKTLKAFITGIFIMANLSCVAKDVQPDTSNWYAYNNDVIGFRVSYQLPGNMRETIRPQNIAKLNGDPGFGAVFDVGYDYKKATQDVPKFKIAMQVHSFVEELNNCSFQEFTRALSEYEKYTTRNSTSPANATPNRWEPVKINELTYALFTTEKSVSYSICLNEKYFLRITASYGRYSRQSEDWVSQRKSIVLMLIEKIYLPDIRK